jgi:hypothetical protein
MLDLPFLVILNVANTINFPIRHRLKPEILISFYLSLSFRVKFDRVTTFYMNLIIFWAFCCFSMNKGGSFILSSFLRLLI